MRPSQLEKLKTPHGAYVVDEASGLPVFHVSNPHVFVQAAGYLKHVSARDEPSAVYYRGQSRLYPQMKPSLYRAVKEQAGKEGRDRALNAYLEQIAEERKVLRQVGEYAREPLLQHYGIRTRWVDLVDNVWVALWFACHDVVVAGRMGEYLHFERRRRPHGPDRAYAYVVMMKAGIAEVDPECPGLFRCADSEVIDLRIAAPSTFVRPHAQHGLLMRRTRFYEAERMDYADFVVGTLRVEIGDALEWLGAGALLGTHTLFPPPAYDFGYRELLAGAPPPSDVLGAIHHIGA